MRSLIRNSALIIVVLLVAAWSIMPPEKKLRLGKDLRGGVSLVYSVQVSPSDPPDVVGRVIDVLKKRIDPNGLSEISLVKQGQDRLEITMPLPGPRVKKLKDAFLAELKALGAMSLDDSGFQQLMRRPPAERAEEIKRIAGSSEGRAKDLTEGATTYDAAMATHGQYTQARDELKKAKEANAPQATIDELTRKVDDLVGKVADAELAADEARKKCVGGMMTEDEVRRALALSNERRTVEDSKTRLRVAQPSPQEQAIESLRKRFPSQKQQLEQILAAYDKFAAERTRLDDPADLKRMLSGAGVLDFRITVDPNAHPAEPRLRQELHEKGPRNVQSADARWYKLNNVDTWYDSTDDLERIHSNPAGYFLSKYGLVAEEYDGDHYVLCWDTPGSRLTKAEGEWKVAGAYASSDPQTGLPAISYEMDNRGATLQRELTKAHVGKHMAVLLDDEVYTAPNLRSAIGKSGQITGSFDDRELNYIINVLAAGSLQAKLSPEPISEVTLAPELGADNLRAGLKAGLIALVVIGGFMIVYYFGSGVISVVCLLFNALLILGLMALNSAAFTMPGIAGVILTFGMAVDANVLIYERMREELQRGLDLRNATRLGYNKAMSSIVDGNVTNLIHCVVLYFVGTQEIKGFAITMGIGVLTTLFCVWISRQIYAWLVDYGPWRRASMLPLVIPAIDRFFHRDINWLRLRWVFWTFSAAYVALGMGMVLFRGKEMLDTQFRGGSQIAFKLKEGAEGQPRTMTRKDVEGRLRELGAGALPGDESLQQLSEASVLAVNPAADGVTSNQFQIRTLAVDTKVVHDAIAAKFGDVLDTRPALTYVGRDTPETSIRRAPVYQVLSPTLGENIQRPDYHEQVREYIGGAAIVLENIDPPQPVSSLTDRMNRTRELAEFSSTLGRQRKLLVLAGDDLAVRTAVLVVRDPGLSALDDEQRWYVEVAGVEWRLVHTALANSSTSASVEVISPTIAKTFTAQAVVALTLGFILVGIYIWVRFGTLSYALAGIIPLFHDVLTAIGLIAVAQILYEWPAGQPLAHALGIMPFKIDLNMVAALLTIVGYSLNDTIIVMDRIRENRGKMPFATEEMINSAVNKTVSRTVITSGTVLMASVVLYLVGGAGMRGFSYALIIGVVVGTYSSIAIAAPIVWVRKAIPAGSGTPPPPPPPVDQGKAFMPAS
jgi:SecD/SecF fusion protein